MAVIRKSEIAKLSPQEMQAKLVEFNKAMLELRGEGRKDKVRPLRKAIAGLKTRIRASEIKAAAGKKATTAKPTAVVQKTAKSVVLSSRPQSKALNTQKK